MTLKEKLQHRYALSEKGAQDMIRAFISVTISDIVLMLPVGMLYIWKERSVRPYQCDYGRLCHHGDSIFALDSGTDRCVYFYSISGCEPFLFELENGNRSSLGTSGFISDRALFR